MSRTILQDLSSDHVWARNTIKGFLVNMGLWQRNKEIRIPVRVMEEVALALLRLERAVKQSYEDQKFTGWEQRLYCIRCGKKKWKWKGGKHPNEGTQLHAYHFERIDGGPGPVEGQLRNCGCK